MYQVETFYLLLKPQSASQFVDLSNLKFLPKIERRKYASFRR